MGYAKSIILHWKGLSRVCSPGFRLSPLIIEGFPLIFEGSPQIFAKGIRAPRQVQNSDLTFDLNFVRMVSGRHLKSLGRVCYSRLVVKIVCQIPLPSPPGGNESQSVQNVFS